jgi:hypothetical protein
MNRFALTTLIIMTLFNPANATKINAPTTGIPECSEDAHKLCSAVLFDLDKRLACMRAHRSELSQACIAAIRARR